MAGNITLKQDTLTTLVSSGAALANGSVSAASSSYNNNSSNDFWGNFELFTGFASAPTVGNSIELYGVPALDGSDYADVDTSTPNMPLSCFLGVFSVIKSQTGAQRLVLMGVPLMPNLYEFYLYNKSGQQMSSGWTLKISPAYEQYT